MAYNRRIIESTQNHNASKNIKAKARILRKRMTDAEKTLWTYLRREQQVHFANSPFEGGRGMSKLKVNI